MTLTGHVGIMQIKYVIISIASGSKLQPNLKIMSSVIY